jgi:hypothetical protein
MLPITSDKNFFSAALIRKQKIRFIQFSEIYIEHIKVIKLLAQPQHA